MTAKEARMLFAARVDTIEGMEAQEIAYLQDRCNALESKLNELILVLNAVLEVDLGMYREEGDDSIGHIICARDPDSWHRRKLRVKIDPLESPED